MISKGRKSVDISNINEPDIAAYYLNVKELPCLIHSPLRKDNHPSFTLYRPVANEVNYKDFATGDKGTIWTLLTKLWNCSYYDAKLKVYNDFGDRSIIKTSTISIHGNFYGSNDSNNSNNSINNSSNNWKYQNINIQCKVREWRDYDVEYWKSYGISLKWLKYADVYPISYKIVTKGDKSYTFLADEYAYVFVEFKEGKTTLKVYQPYNTKGYKWSNNHDKSVVSLWTKVPEYGNRICICSSLKDALCLWSNTGIPSIAVQGEGYSMSNTAIKELKRRYRQIYVCFDNDSTGLKDAEIFSSATGFRNIVLPIFKGGKDISDLYKTLNNKNEFKKIILKLFEDD